MQVNETSNLCMAEREKGFGLTLNLCSKYPRSCKREEERKEGSKGLGSQIKLREIR